MYAHIQSSANTATMESLVDVAAAVETRLHAAEARARALQQDLQQLQRRQDHVKQWIVTIRRCHRSRSHAATARVIREALAYLESSHPLMFSLF